MVQVKAAVLDPDNEFNVERALTKEDVHRLIEVEQLVGSIIIYSRSGCNTVL